MKTNEQQITCLNSYLIKVLVFLNSLGRDLTKCPKCPKNRAKNYPFGAPAPKFIPWKQIGMDENEGPRVLTWVEPARCFLSPFFSRSDPAVLASDGFLLPNNFFLFLFLFTFFSFSLFFKRETRLRFLPLSLSLPPLDLLFLHKLKFVSSVPSLSFNR